MRRLARDEAAGPYEVQVDVTDAPVQAIIERAAGMDLVVLGLGRRERVHRPLGELARAIARSTDVPVVMISRRPSRTLAGLSTPQFLVQRPEAAP